MPPFPAGMKLIAAENKNDASCLLMMSLMTKNVRPPTRTPTSA